MSQQERDWLDWLKRARDKQLTQREAAEKMGVSERWVRKLLKRMEQEGDGVVVHGLRGRTSNRRISEDVQQRALQILREPDWHDFGPTYAAEQLRKRHQIEVSDETVRQWMLDAGLWKSRARRLAEVHTWRPRRSGFGELVQWDTSEHDWLEGRGPVRHLVRLIDDASSWSWGRFVERDATPFNMGVLWEYLEQHGRMEDVYTDRDSMFVAAAHKGETLAERTGPDRLTQLGRALRELGIGWIAAYSPEAKGRLRAQFLDRAGPAGEGSAPGQGEDAGRRQRVSGERILARQQRPVCTAHRRVSQSTRPLTPYLDLAAILCHIEERVIANDYTFSFASRQFQIARQDIQPGMRRQRLRLEVRLDGEVYACYQGKYLTIARCGEWPTPVDLPKERPKTPRHDHNAGGKSRWMQGFFDRPAPPLWKCLE